MTPDVEMREIDPALFDQWNKMLAARSRKVVANDSAVKVPALESDTIKDVDPGLFEKLNRSLSNGS